MTQAEVAVDFGMWADAHMLRIEVLDSGHVLWSTPFVVHDGRLYLVEEAGERADEFEGALLGREVAVADAIDPDGHRLVGPVRRVLDHAEAATARRLIHEKFPCDQALADLHACGLLLAIDPPDPTDPD